MAAPRQSLRDYFYKNADADELLFIHRGSGTLRTLLGNIPFEYGDYLVIPRGVLSTRSTLIHRGQPHPLHRVHRPHLHPQALP